jgi:hypothetical protein
MSQIALPLSAGLSGPDRIIVGNANAAIFEASRATGNWPFRTAVVSGPSRSGKSLIARWFEAEGKGAAIDDADQIDETELFHRWNRAQESATPLLVVNSTDPGPWTVRLPDLASRLGAALQLRIGEPDDAMIAELIALHGEARGLTLGSDAAAYLVPRCERSHMGIERLVATIDRLSLERKVAPTQGIWRDALDELIGPREPRLL